MNDNEAQCVADLPQPCDIVRLNYWGRTALVNITTLSMLLHVCRSHLRLSDATQQVVWHMSAADVRRLAQQPLPRTATFAADVLRIAIVCSVGNRSAFQASLEQAAAIVAQGTCCLAAQ